MRASWVCPTCGARNPNSATNCRECGAARVKGKSVADARLASFLQRVFAQLIDGIVLLFAIAAMVAMGLTISPEWGLEGHTLVGLTVNQFVALATIVVGVLYHAAFLAIWGATIGKLILGIQVVRTDGGPISWWEGFVRTVAVFASLVTLGLVFLLIVRDRTNQGLHDKLADTMVVRG